MEKSGKFDAKVRLKAVSEETSRFAKLLDSHRHPINGYDKQALESALGL